VAHWSLFVDESGRFERPEDDVAVAGLLMPTPAMELAAGRVWRELGTALPHVPPPPHRWLVEKPVAHLGWHALDGFAHVSAERRAAHHEAAALLERELPDEWRALLERLPRIDDEPPSRLVRRLGQRLDRLGPAGPVRDEQREALAQVVRAIARLAEPLPGWPSAVIVAAGEEALGAGAPDRYRSALAAAIERSVDAVLALAGPGDHQLSLHAMRRPASHLDEDGLRALAMQAGLPRHRASASLGIDGVGLHDRFVRRDGQPSPHPEPWPVVCDWIAYAARHHVAKDAPWAQVREGLEAELQLPASAGAGLRELPLAASVGTCSRGWRAARMAGSPFPGEGAPTRGWCVDQARLWSEVPW
jgi:hypothetical protein